MRETPERKLIGWRDLQTGKWWPLPEGHQKPSYTVSERYEAVYVPVSPEATDA